MADPTLDSLNAHTVTKVSDDPQVVAVAYKANVYDEASMGKTAYYVQTDNGVVAFYSGDSQLPEGGSVGALATLAENNKPEANSKRAQLDTAVTALFTSDKAYQTAYPITGDYSVKGSMAHANNVLMGTTDIVKQGDHIYVY